MMKQISDHANKIIRNIIKKQNPILSELVINWGKIVGVKFATESWPIKISSSTEKEKRINILQIGVSNSSMSMEMAYQQELIIERIAIYLGYRAISSLKFVIR
ncbi:MAG: DUF721 domain-containing protein [Rickettsiales bacterium]|nr:DUF721 domain-containing protein [Rickettsiales bacterium]MCA0254931.1 DUF721 domain-containing protein [Pseudomonadota bacterium]